MAEEAKKKKDRGLWFREMKSELKKVVWPNKQTVMKNTGTVLLCSLVIGARSEEHTSELQSQR